MSRRRKPLIGLPLVLAAALLLFRAPVLESRARPMSQTESSNWPMLQADVQRTGWSPSELVSPFTHKWTWVPPNEDILPSLNQPVFGDGKVFIGSYTGVMYAVDDRTGDTAWSYQADGGIMHTAAYDNGKVYFTSLDFNIYCVDAASGRLRWSHETGASVVTSPLVVDDKVYTGSRDKSFYALDASTGSLIWSYQTEGPIDQSAAYSQGYVIFGSEDMHVYSLNAETGALRWRSPKLYGQLFGHFWPVIAESANLVMVRTLPSHASESQLAGGIETILCEHCPTACENWDQNPCSHNQWPAVQEDIRQFYQEDSHRRTFFALNLDTGEDVFSENPPAVPYIGRHADIPSPPWVDDQGNIYVHFRSTSAWTQEPSYGTHFRTDMGTLDPQTGSITTLVPVPGSIDSHFTCMDVDDNGIFTMGGSLIYGTHNQRGGGALDIADNQPYCVLRNHINSAPYGCDTQPPVVYDTRSPRGMCLDGDGCANRGEGMSGLAISGDTIYSTRAPYGEVVAVRGTLR